MTIPTTAGRIGRAAGKSVGQLALDQTQIVGWRDVQRYFLGQGAPQSSVDTAISFYQGVLAREIGSPRQALLELLAVDFKAPVQRVILEPKIGAGFLTYVVGTVTSRNVRPNNGRVRLEPSSGRPVRLNLGGFITDRGVGPDRLGISPTPARIAVQLRLLQPVPALKSRSAGAIDAWSDRPFVAPGQSRGSAILHMAGGGGVQYRVPREKVRSDEYFAIV